MVSPASSSIELLKEKYGSIRHAPTSKMGVGHDRRGNSYYRGNCIAAAEVFCQELNTDHPGSTFLMARDIGDYIHVAAGLIDEEEPALVTAEVVLMGFRSRRIPMEEALVLDAKNQNVTPARFVLDTRSLQTEHSDQPGTLLIAGLSAVLFLETLRAGLNQPDRWQAVVDAAKAVGSNAA